MSISWSVCLWVEIVNVCICQDVLGFMCVCFSISIQWNVCIYMSECVYVFMYLYVCDPMKERDIESERDRERGEISSWMAI